MVGPDGRPAALPRTRCLRSLPEFLGLSRVHQPSSTEWDEVLAKDRSAARAVVRGAAQAAPADRGSVYSRQIFQITPVPGIWTSGASAATLNLLAGSDWPKSRTAP